MSEEDLREAATTLERADGFVPQPEPRSFTVDVSPFDARVGIESGSVTVRYAVTVRVPTLDDVVEESVDPVITEGWLDTFELRMEDLNGATQNEVEPPTVALEADQERVRVQTEFETGVPSSGVADTRAVVQYVEGTFMEGIIPGYQYREPVAGMLQRASDQSWIDGSVGNDVDVGPGGTPL